MLALSHFGPPSVTKLECDGENPGFRMHVGSDEIEWQRLDADVCRRRIVLRRPKIAGNRQRPQQGGRDNGLGYVWDAEKCTGFYVGSNRCPDISPLKYNLD
jgi:hypothetical protein